MVIIYIFLFEKNYFTEYIQATRCKERKRRRKKVFNWKKNGIKWL